MQLERILTLLEPRQESTLPLHARRALTQALRAVVAAVDRELPRFGVERQAAEAALH